MPPESTQPSSSLSSSDARYYIYIFMGFSMDFSRLQISVCMCACVYIVFAFRHAYVFKNKNTDRIKYRSDFSHDANDRFARKFCINIENLVQKRWRASNFIALAHSLIVRKKCSIINTHICMYVCGGKKMEKHSPNYYEHVTIPNDS